MRYTLFKLLSPMASLLLLLLGNGLVGTLIPVRMELENASPLIIGVVSAAYYAGLMVGAFHMERLVTRIGHIRTFAAFAATLSGVYLLQGIWVDAISWFIYRLVAGYCMAGLYITIESWFLSVGTVSHRGRLLAMYMTVLYAGQALGQYLLYLGDPKDLVLFCVVSILTSFAIVPLAVTRIASPNVEAPEPLSLATLYAISPTGVVGAACSGALLGCCYSLIPIYLMGMEQSSWQVANKMGILILGGMLLQYPMGKLSDFMNRRQVILYIAVAVVLLSGLMVGLVSHYPSWLLWLCFLLGGFTFVMYPLSISHACDFVSSPQILAATQGLLFAYGIGAMLGPILGSGMMTLVGPNGLLIFFMVLMVALIWFILIRQQARPPLTLQEQHEFHVGSSTTPIASEMDPRIQDRHS